MESASLVCFVPSPGEIAMVVVLACLILGIAPVTIYLWRLSQRRAAEARVRPRLRLTKWGRVMEAEGFPDYVARQVGFGSLSDCPSLGSLASDYLREGKDCEANIYTFIVNASDIPEPKMLCQKFIDELDKCILGYFGFHWSHAAFLMNQALTSETTTTPKMRLKSIVMEATRKLRFERVMKDLKVTRLFSTLVDEMKVMGIRPQVMVPADRNVRSPVLLLIGGGMGAGKSTVLGDILKEPLWSDTNPVVVQADAFKESDVIYRALSSRGVHNDLLPTAELVHQSSIDAASSLLVTALNEGRDVVMDGTLSWPPFVEQTIAMARSVHLRRYRMSTGYVVAQDGTVTETYWEPVLDQESCTLQQHHQTNLIRKPYRIEMVGVVCDAYLAVVRGIRRAITMGRAVRVRSQLKSHKRFACAFPGYSRLVDNARLYSTNQLASPPKLIGWKDGNSNFLVDTSQISCLEQVSLLNEEAESIHDLYPRSHSPLWREVVMSPFRRAVQKELKEAITQMESTQED